jgi:peptide/nickel transport system permease protein
MQRYIVIRLVQSIFVMLAISIIVFGLTRLSGNPITLMLPIDAGPEDFERLNKFWGLDQPQHVQYWKFVSNAVQGDFGQSFKWPGRSAMDLVGVRLLATIQLTLTALLLGTAMAVLFGVVTAAAKDTPLDYLGKIIALLGQSAPSFWIGIMLIWIFAVQVNWLPTSGRGGISHMVLPVVTLGWFQVAAVMRLVRSSMLETLDSEYVKLARIKGLSEWKVIWKHCLRNAAIAPLTYFGILAGALVTGSVIVETVFAWPGIGLLIIEAVLARDFQVVQAVAMVLALGFVMINLTVDILYAYVDPRIRYG